MNRRTTGEAKRRGRGSLPGLAVLVLLAGLAAACDRDDVGPAAEPVDEYRTPETVQGPSGEPQIRNIDARERLIVRTELPERGHVTLLFLDGRAASPFAGERNGPDTGSIWGDLNGERALVFDERGRITRILQGGSEGAPALSAPMTARTVEDGMRIEERDGSAILFPHDGPPVRPDARAPAPVVSAAYGLAFAARSPLYFSIAPVQPGEPLLWRIESDGHTRPKGEVTRPDNNMLGELVNTGWAAGAPDEGSYFAPALRPELLRFDAEGELLWSATWQPERTVPDPGFEVVNGSLEPVFSVVHHGLVPGPDGRTYLLAASREDRQPDRLLAFDDEGVLERTGRVPPGAAIFADERGRIYVLSLEEALSRTPAADRRTFEAFELPSLTSSESVALDDFQGKVVVVNFWASWCPPCRREMPLLDELFREMADRDVVVVGLNEDTRPQDGRDFLDELGGVAYPNAAGEGQLRARYGYRGLPYTLILDREHRVARTLYGFGTSIDPIRDAVEEALAEDTSLAASPEP